MKNLFRNEAKENFKEDFAIDKQLLRIKYSTQVMALLLLIGIFLYIIWLCFGKMARTTELDGIIYPYEGIKAACAEKDGTVRNIIAEAGDWVEMGEVLAVVPDEENLNALDYSYQLWDETEKNEFDKKLNKYEMNEYINNSFVRSPANGHIISILPKGTNVKKGDQLALIAASSNEFSENQVLVFLPTENDIGIKEGNKVQISLNNAQREKYGYITGYIYSIEENVLTKKDALTQYGFYNIPDMLEDGKTYFVVRINFDINDKYESGLAWSLETSGAIEPKAGTQCKCSVIVEQTTPLQWLFGR